MRFEISLARRPQRRMDVRLELDEDAVDAALAAAGRVELWQATWTPGSYLIREYSRFVDDVALVTPAGPVPLVKTAKNCWEVASPHRPSARTEIRYSVYMSDLTVRGGWVGEEFAFWTGAAALLWPRGLERRAADVRVELPTGWLLSCQAVEEGLARAGAAEFSVSGLDEAIDSPCLLAPERETEILEFEAAGRPVRFVAVGMAGIPLPKRLADDTRKLVEQNVAAFGAQGRVPYDRYDFQLLGSDGGRGGLEHDSSSVLQHPRTGFSGKEYEQFLGLVAHEHFHVWNVRRMRPVSLVEIDYEREVDTSDLWVCEGFTAYFDDLVCRRAGVLSRARYLEELATNWSNYRQCPGRNRQSLSASAADAWVRLYRPQANSRNVTQNYYAHGALAAACIDAMLRMVSDNEAGLEDVLRGLYQRTFEMGRGFTRHDLVAVMGELANGHDWDSELRQMVDSTDDLPFVERMAEAYGIRVETKPPKRPSLGIQIRSGSTQIAFVRDGEAGRAAGLTPDDEILGVEGLRVTPSNWSSVFDAVLREGQSSKLLVARQGRITEVLVVPTMDGVREAKLVEHDDVDEAVSTRREAFLGVRAGG